MGTQMNGVEYQVHGEDVNLHTQCTVTRAVSKMYGVGYCGVLLTVPHDEYNITALIRHS